ncbi:MAG: hypothetical protein ACRC1D_00225, partial [Culicoidibacterales bacterium]
EFFQTQELACEAVEIEPRAIEIIPQNQVTQKMVNVAMACDPYVIQWVQNKYKTVKNCYEILQSIPELHEYIPTFVSRKYAS